ncbi:MAG: hypothetical protein H6741_33495 [Alphaproteobacteria bacterium]|nr:hypothetical protein [Alphaproteobacteria bacterium]
MRAPHEDWRSRNQRALNGALESLRGALTREARIMHGEIPEEDPPPPADPPVDSALAQLTRRFGLSPFERQVLVLAAAPELQPGLTPLFATLAHERSKPWPTVELALRALAGSHWDAFTPAAPLRRWRLLHLGEGEGLVFRSLRVDERVLHFLMGASYLAPEVRERVSPAPTSAHLPPPLHALAEHAATLLVSTERPHVQLRGPDAGDVLAVASTACRLRGRTLWVLPASELPQDSAARDELALLWCRETTLEEGALLLDLSHADHAGHQAALSFARACPTPLLIGGGGTLPSLYRPLRELALPSRPTLAPSLGRTASA